MLCSCVDQHPGASTAPEKPRIIATSPVILQMCDVLELELAARCATAGTVPERYQSLPEVGPPMAPDAEAIALLEPTDVISPASLQSSLQPAYKAAGIPATFVDLESVSAMYGALSLLGERYNRQSQAEAAVAAYRETLAALQSQRQEKAPTVLLLMGLPGAYVEATPRAYCGSLLELAGAVNVIQVQDEEAFVNWNTEALLQLNPDYILLTAHGLPEQAMDMFAREFAENDVWKHFRAVQEGRVYQLDPGLFGMSCNFDWPRALEILREIFDEESG